MHEEKVLVIDGAGRGNKAATRRAVKRAEV